jgi:GAF domain-containing protein
MPMSIAVIDRDYGMQRYIPLFERALAGEIIRQEALRFESGGIVSYRDVVPAPLVEDGEVRGILNVTMAERQEFERQRIRSLVVVPMVYRGTTVGFVGFDSVRQEKAWREESIQLLRPAAAVFADAPEQRRAQVRL